AALHDKNLAAIAVVDTRTGILKRLFAYLEQTPIIDIKKTAAALESAYNTTSNAVKKLMELGILVPVDNSKRERSFAYEEYLAILRKDT
ncbi:MAG: Fic family protein, partial [Clostridia bacterium]